MNFFQLWICLTSTYFLWEVESIYYKMIPLFHYSFSSFLTPCVFVTDKLRLIKQNLSWVEALYYCREQHHDLASITNKERQRWVGKKVEEASTPHIWLGIRYTCTLNFWFWVSNERVNYTEWSAGGSGDKCSVSGAIDRGGEHKWYKKPEGEKFNFICSDS